MISLVRRFFQLEAAGAVVLAGTTAVAIGWANSPASGRYTDLAGGPAGDGAAGLMAVFFFVVGLEIRRELSAGELAGRQAALPVLAAVGGMVVPALVYLAINRGGDAQAGWAIPAATDIAFAIGVVTLLGDRVSNAARLFLLSLAVADDALAVVVIALFYGHAPGIHATVGGVAVGLLLPARIGTALERLIHPWSAYVVLPLFALTHAGVSLSGAGHAAADPVAWGVALGLVAGKPAGILLAAWAAVRLGVARRPEGLAWRELAGVATVAGVGFTVSLFVTTLAFGDSSRQAADATLGIFGGSLLAGGLGAALLSRRPRRRPAPSAERPTGTAAARRTR